MLDGHVIGDASKTAASPYIFNTGRYAALHDHRFSDRQIRVADDRGVFHAVETAPGHFTSPGRASFGGFEVWRETDLDSFIDQAEYALLQAGAKTWDIVGAPLCYGGDRAARDIERLCRRGYVVTRQELNQSLPVDSRTFLDIGNYANRKRFHKSARLGVTSLRLDPEHFRAAYDAVAENRAKKGRTLSMSWPDVEQLATAFPDQVMIFGAFAQAEMLGAAICVEIGHGILYVYAWGERAGAEAASPVTALAHAIHDHARLSGFTMVDLGTSSVDGVVNPGLAAFKRSLGAEPSLKLWLRKTIRDRSTQPPEPASTPVACDYAAIYDPETDFDRWYTLLTAKRILGHLQPGQSILELGSATGLLTQALAAEGRDIVCLERAATYIARARARNLPNVEIRETNIEDDTSDRRFDHVLAINVLHEINDPAALLLRLRDRLAPAGLLHVTLPNPNSLHRLSAHAAGMIESPSALSGRGQRFGTLRLQTADAFAASLASIGLREVRRESILIKPLPNAAMAALSDDIIEAYDALSAALPESGAMFYSVFSHA